MARRALLIGSQTGGLQGVHGDVAVMREALEHHGFSTTVAVEKEATHDGIFEAYRGLIDDTSDADAVVVYYSGHGGRSRPPLELRSGLPTWLQFIVPTDAEDYSGGRFRGLLAEELSLLQWQLTDRTRNVTTIWDCCHSARMSRRTDLIPKANERLGGFSWDGVRSRWSELRENPRAASLGSDANPHAVRIVACSPDESAYELNETELGGSHGALTSALVTALLSPTAMTLTWRQVLNVVRPSVIQLVPQQRSEVEGPADRVLFTTDEIEATGVRPVLVQGDVVLLEGADLFGMVVGDTYSVVNPGGDVRNPVATGVVDLIADGRARLRLDGAKAADVERGAEAHPMDVSLGARPVAVLPADDPQRRRILDALAGSSYVRPVVQETAVLATVRLEDGGFRLFDAAGEPLDSGTRPMSTGSLGLLARDLRRLAAAVHFLELASGTGNAELGPDVQVTYARLTAEGEVDLPPSGEQLYVGDRFVVRYWNMSSEPRYVALFDVGLTGAISLMTSSEPAGVTLAPGETYEVGRNSMGVLEGIELFWPDGLPALGPRPETYVSIVAAEKVEGLDRLGQAGVRSARRSEDFRPVSALGRLLEDLEYGRRDGRVAPAPAKVAQYRVDRLDFLLQPTARVPAAAEPAFEIDERPHESLRLVVPRGADAPQRVALRLTDITVHSNRSLFKARVRVDALVVTAVAEGGGQPYGTATVFVDRVKDGDRLPLENVRVYDGPVNRFLDLAVWVSKADQKEVELAELIAKEAAGEDVKAALGVLAGLAVASPQTALVVASVGAVATLVRLGARVVSAAAGTSIGMYRTSFLPHERFGAGRHPSDGVISAQDMSFAFSVEPVDQHGV